MVNQHYLNRYNSFIGALKEQTINGYCEIHHIIPRSSGGTDSKDNLIALTARQHFIAHWILWKAYGNNMARAFFMMSNFGKYGKVNSKVYSNARQDYSKQVSIQMTGKVMPPISEETRQKMSKSALGKVVSQETRDKISASTLGKKRDAEFAKKISEAKKGKTNGRIGYTQSKETKLKIAEANFNRPIIQCPHCLKLVKDHGGAKRWHFDNCKYLKGE